MSDDLEVLDLLSKWMQRLSERREECLARLAAVDEEIAETERQMEETRISLRLLHGPGPHRITNGQMIAEQNGRHE